MAVVRTLQDTLDGILVKLQDEEHKTMGPIITLMKFIGAWHPGRSKAKAVLFNCLLAFSLLFIANIVTYALKELDFKVIINLFQFFVLPMGSMKVYFYLNNHKKWESFYFGILDVENKSIATEGEHKDIVLKYRKYTQYLIVCYWSFETTAVITYYICFWVNNVIIPIAYNDINKTDYIIMYYTWSLFDEGNLSGRIITGVVKIVFSSIACFYVYFWDATMLATMCFLAGQLKALRVRCANALDDSQEDICINNIAQCHQHYLELLKYSVMFNDLISTPILLYMGYLSIQTGVNIVLAVISENLAYGIFKSKWVGANKRVRRAALILGIRMRKRIAFTIGPFKEMSLDTYISIVKFSYSFYTLLKTKKPEIY